MVTAHSSKPFLHVIHGSRRPKVPIASGSSMEAPPLSSASVSALFQEHMEASAFFPFLESMTL